MEKEQDKQFFLSQRYTVWRVCMVATDVTLIMKEEAAKQKMEVHERRRDRAQMVEEASASRFRM